MKTEAMSQAVLVYAPDGRAANMKKHHWECEDCGHLIMFRQPELPGDDPRSEANEDKTCPKCGGDMYFDEVDAGGNDGD